MLKRFFVANSFILVPFYFYSGVPKRAVLGTVRGEGGSNTVFGKANHFVSGDRIRT